jgi:hypothetical protein
MSTNPDEQEYLAPLKAMVERATQVVANAALRDLGDDHLHDFHTGSARCTICKLTPEEAGVQSGGRVLGPAGAKDDGWRVGEDGTSLRGDRMLAAPDRVDEVRLTRMDVVVHPHGLVRRPGEDDASLATRLRRLCATPRYTLRPPVPPMGWTPPPGFKLGDDWRTSVPLAPTTLNQGDEFFFTIDQHGASQTRVMKKVN